MLLPDKCPQTASSALGRAAKCSRGSTVRVSCLLGTRARGNPTARSLGAAKHPSDHGSGVGVIGKMGQELAETIPKTKWHDEATWVHQPRISNEACPIQHMTRNDPTKRTEAGTRQASFTLSRLLPPSSSFPLPVTSIGSRRDRQSIPDHNNTSGDAYHARSRSHTETKPRLTVSVSIPIRFPDLAIPSP